ncbi:interleukin-1 receptor-associated kinase 4 isoform X1 [Heterocephalus glaber]|uniref:Interleukin-1 receptor-associated kinase 4 n=2 Tax=Heterocephalus glaber TaxID=10181 RepID=A0A0P6J4P2_HETGA|nr:interleukin-1 receptor-associated kinase 4 isoform X1 [Heterocephalus glaber]XP_012934503.1 interleukin-1 receptor-associated kinase 4 isoform X1 [Heterocephalus glaber]XP_012934504.1 interleukin-1 receptor-associated kinase 4 isoform X1 [Heterocephalus glaber]XP_012934505.1 interleukin-1 receptor-associated kinase 4 isoform X1 [Heterocephalus glaber]XP_012934506.1 interleukin-1 receptor-associated kinase 4 isoform X1 [Heterocephalus glaber]
MNKPITPSTYVRCLNVGLIRKLSDFIDPQEGWKKLAVAIKKPSGDDRYNQFHIRRFEALVQTGKSPTSELLFDWGTTNCTVGDLVDILIQNELFAPASLLLPDAIPKPVNTVPSKEAVTVQQQHMPFYEKGTTPPAPVQSLDQDHIPRDSSSSENNSLEVSDTRFHCFSFYELKNVTNDFDERPISLGGNKMGEGGFGVVYKGCVNNTTVAVKKLAAMVDISTEELKQQFDQEIKVMAKCQHENLVELLGFSSDGDDLCLVYVYMPNGSLLDRLSCLDGTPPLSWHMRCKIAQGAANGISFLHENHHIHRDIKSANILLDEDFTAKISDFGLARASEKFAQTVMTSRVVGTTAYMAPEALRGEITPKSDIYSFGVVLLEIITGLPAVDEKREPQLLLDIKEEIEDEEKTIEDYIDVKINDADSTSVETMYSVASQCLHEKKNRRPDIKKVQQQLQEITAS